MKKQPSLLETIINIIQKNNQSIETLTLMANAEDSLKNIEFLAGAGTFAWPARSALTTAAGLVADQTPFLIPPIGTKGVLKSMGATFLRATNNVHVPYSSSFVATLKGETGEAEEGTGTVGSTSFKALRATAWVEFSKQLNLQAGPDLEPWLINGITNAIDRVCEQHFFGIAARTATDPQGIGYKCTVGTDTKENAVVPSASNILALEEEIEGNSCLSGNLAFLTSHKGARILERIPLEAGLDRYLLENGRMLGYPVFASPNVSNAAGADGLGALLVFGRMSDLCLVQFGDYWVTINPITYAKTGKLEIVVHAYFDFHGLQSPVTTGSGTQDDEYSLSFASMAIKAS
jgi:HK97 family phage major capsid protein